MDNTSALAWVGIDISKDTFDVCLLRPDGRPLTKKFDNAPAGFGQLLCWVGGKAPDFGCHFCMEATGNYGLALALSLAESGHKVSVVAVTPA